MAIGSYTEDQIQRLLLDADNYKREIKDVAKLVRQQQAHEKNLKAIRGQLEKQTDKLSASNQAFAHAVGSLASKAVMKLGEAIKGTVDTALKWDDWVGKSPGKLRELSASIDGMADSMLLAKTRGQLMGNEFGATEKQVEAVLKASVQWMRVNKDDLEPSIQKLVDAVRTGRDSVFRKLGFDVEFLGSKSDKTAKALQLLEEKYGDTKVSVENANEAVMSAKAAWDDLTGSFGAAVIQGLKLTKVLKGLAGWLRGHQGIQMDMWDPNYKPDWADPNNLPWVKRANALEATRRPGVSSAPWAGGPYYGPYSPSGIGGGAPSKNKIRAGGAPRPEQMVPAGWGQQTIFEQPPGAPATTPDQDTAQIYGSAASAILSIGEASREARKQVQLMNKAMMDERVKGVTEETEAAFASLAQNGIAAAYSGILDLAVAAIQGKENLGQMALQMAAGTALGASRELFVMGLAATFKAKAAAMVPWTAPLAAAYTAQAGTYFAGAGVLGGLGLAATAGAAAVGGGSGGGAAVGGGSGGGSSYRPSIGQTTDREQPDIHLDVYISPESRAHALGTMKTIKMVTKQAAK